MDPEYPTRWLQRMQRRRFITPCESPERAGVCDDDLGLQRSCESVEPPCHGWQLLDNEWPAALPEQLTVRAWKFVHSRRVSQRFINLAHAFGNEGVLWSVPSDAQLR